MSFNEIYTQMLYGSISGLDRIRFRGTIRSLGNVLGMEKFLSYHKILLKDFKNFVLGTTRSVVKSAEQYASEQGVPYLYLNSSQISKEELARSYLIPERPGLVCVLRTVETCRTFTVGPNKANKSQELRSESGKCAHYYFYFDDPQYGFGHIRLQSWYPFSVTINLNRRHWLERQLQEARIDYRKADNCFVRLENVVRAQELLDAQLRTDWPTMLGMLMRNYVPFLPLAVRPLLLEYYWSAEETEYATDYMFKNSRDLDRMFPMFCRHAMMHFGAPAILRFLGKNEPKGHWPDEITSDCRRRYNGVRVKHWVSGNSIKMYNKAGSILRIETTICNNRDLKVFRQANDDPTQPFKWQHLRKGVADLHRRCQISQAANQRYADAIAETPTSERLNEMISSISKRVKVDKYQYRAIKIGDAKDQQLLQFIAQGQWTVSGFRNRDLASFINNGKIPANTKAKRRLSAKTSRLIRLLKAHHLIAKIPHESRYRITSKGQKITATLLIISNVEVQKLMDMAA